MGCTTIANTQHQCNLPKTKNLLQLYNALRDLKTSIKNFKDNNPLNVYLISTNSIPDFVAFLNEKKEKLDKLMNEQKQNLDPLINELSSYEINYNEIQIYNDYEKCKEIMDKNNEEENEFMIVNDKIIKIMNIPGANDKCVKMKYYKNNQLEIEFISSHKALYMTTTNDDYYKFIKCEDNNNNQNIKNKSNIGSVITNDCVDKMILSLINSGTRITNAYFNWEGSIHNPLFNDSSVNSQQKNNNNTNTSNNNNSIHFNNNINFNNSINNNNNSNFNNHKITINNQETIYLTPLLYLMCNISPLVNYFLNNKQIFQQIQKNDNKYIVSKSFSEIIYNISDVKNINSLNLDNLKQFIYNSQNNYNPNTLISFLYFQLHKELSDENDNNNIICYNYNKTNLLQELYNCRNSIKKSIILDNFCFEFITINRCMCCNLCTYDCCQFNSFHFSLEETLINKRNIVRNGFESININDCFNFCFNTLFTDLCKSCNNTANIFNKIYSLPDIMTCILIRNNYVDDIEFSIDYTIDIKNCLYNLDNKQENTKYQLIGIVSYYKEQTGIFDRSLFKSFKDNNWYFYNGSIVKTVDNVYEIDKGIPYILIYQKIKN